MPGSYNRMTGSKVNWRQIERQLQVKFNHRQRLALEFPVKPEDAPARLEGAFITHSVDPRYRKIRIFSDPHRAEKGDGPADKGAEKKYQLSTILTVDLDDGGPVWHFSAGMLYNPTDQMLDMQRLEMWQERMAQQAARDCIPRLDEREHAYVDFPVASYRGIRSHLSLHVRARLELHERSILETVRRDREAVVLAS